MPFRVIDAATVHRLLPMHVCMDLVSDALAGLSAARALNPLRTIMWLPGRTGAIGTMPGYIENGGQLAVKILSVFQGNNPSEVSSHQGFVIVFDSNDGRPLAIVDAGAITAIRTAAVSGVATRLLARDNACELTLLGSGEQAVTHLEAMRVARPIDRVRVWSRTPANARRFAEEHGAEAVDSAEAAVRGAHIVCTLTSSREPVLEGAWLAAGAHVNAVGASAPFARELDTEAVARSRVFVDRRESALAEAGDLLTPIEEGRIDATHIVAEIGNVAAGRAEGRRSNEEITLFKSLGLAVEDVAAACYVERVARERGEGTEVSM